MFIEGLHEKDIYKEKYPFRLVENALDDFEYPSHWHNAVELLYLCKNSFAVKINGKDMLLRERDILFIAPGDIHGFPKNTCRGIRIFIQFDLTNLGGIGIDISKPFSVDTALISSHNNPELHAPLEEQIVKLIDQYRNKDLAYQFALNARIFDIMALLARGSSGNLTDAAGARPGKKVHGLEKLNKAFDYIGQNYRKNISLKDAANFAGFSEYHFSRIFKDTMEMNFHDYLEEYRIKKSERLLSDSNYSITQTAYMSGFNSLSTFNRVFRKVKGCTPTGYKKLYAAGS